MYYTFFNTVGSVVIYSMESHSPPYNLCRPISADTSTGVVRIPISLTTTAPFSFHLGYCLDTDSWIYQWVLWYTTHGASP